jgi:uncharacterized protein YidB (DUF937 family)
LFGAKRFGYIRVPGHDLVISFGLRETGLQLSPRSAVVQQRKEEAMMGLLDQVFGGTGPSSSAGGMSPLNMALMGLLAYRTFEGKGRLADMLGRSPGSPIAPAGGMPGTSMTGGSLGGMIGGLLGGGAGGILSGGLGDLLKQLQQNGQGDKAQSWIGSGPNKAVLPAELEQALGPEKISWLMQQTGMSREELLAGLSLELPRVVDKLTPDGRIPTQEEATRLP